MGTFLGLKHLLHIIHGDTVTRIDVSMHNQRLQKRQGARRRENERKESEAERRNGKERKREGEKKPKG